MGFINFEIRHDNTNVSDHVINYSRFQYICTGIGTIDVQLENINLNRTITPWDKITLYENGDKVGTYIVASVIRSADGGTVTLQCQDYSKKLVDHFVTEPNVVAYTTTTRYWIELFLNEAGLDYEFTGDAPGEIVGPNASYGLSSAYDLIMSLLQQSGWYIYFDQNGKAIVGELNRAGDAYDDVINDGDIISLERARNDARLRNRAVVWGAGDPVTGAWIGADISVNTPWNYDSDDKRAVVLANGMIYSTTVAEDLARKMLNEFSQIANEITIELVNHYGINIGDLLYVRSKYFSGRMMVSTIESSGSKSGLVTKVTLNQKCPRLFAYFGILGQYIPVYIGTWGQGVWKKYTGGSVWTDSSSGLVADALYIMDLFIKNGVLACVTNDGYLYFADITTNIWTKFEHGELIDLNVNLYLEPDVRAICCSIDDMGNIVAGYQYDDGTTKRAWVLTISGSGVLLKAEQIIPQEGEDYTENVKLIDLEAVGYPEEGLIDSIILEGFDTTPSSLGVKKFQNYRSIDPNCYGVGPVPGVYYHNGSFISGGGSGLRAGYIIENDDTLWYLAYYSGAYRLYEYDLTTFTQRNNYLIGPPTEGRIVSNSEMPFTVLYKRNFTTFDIVSADPIYDDSYINIVTWRVYHYTYIIGQSNFTLVNTQDFSPTYNAGGGIIRGSLQNHIITWALTSKEPNDISKKALDVIVYDILGQFGQIHIATTIDLNSSWENDYWDRSILPFFVTSGVGVFVGFIYWFRQRTGLNFTRAKLMMSGASVGAYGTFSQFAGGIPLTLFQRDTTRDGIEPDVFVSPIYEADSFNVTQPSKSNYGASNAYNAYMMISFATVDYWNNDPPGVEDEINLYLGTLSFPELQLYYIDTPCVPSEGTSDPRFIYRNYEWNSQSQHAFIPATLYHVSGRVNRPLYVRTDLWRTGTYEHFIQLIDPITFDSVEISLDSLGFSHNGEQGPTVAIGFYRDDYDGTIYATIKPEVRSGGLGDWGLYGFNFNGNNIKKILNWDQPAHIIKTYAISPAKIKRFTAPASLGGISRILKHTSAPFEAGLIGASLDAQEQTYGIFEVIFEPERPVKVEISKGTPTLIYNTPSLSGGLVINYSPYFAASVTNAADSFYLPPNNTYNIYDGRVFDLSTTSGAFTIASGILPDSLLERYIALATSGEITLIKYDLTEPFYSLITMSGLLALASGAGANPSGAITLFETTNYTLDPYMFIGISGPPPMFFQRGNPYYPYWVNYSYTLPSSDMTIIRTDDFI